MWNEYVYGKQSYKQLSVKYGVSLRTIQRKLDQHKVAIQKIEPVINQLVVLIIDSTYFGHNFGVMVFKDSISKQILHKIFIKSETVELYFQGVKEILKLGYTIKAIVCDGKRGLLTSFRPIPVQMCHFHQVAIVTRYITRNPRIEAAKEFKNIVHKLPTSKKKQFIELVESWYKKWKSYLDERSLNPETNKSAYTHKRLRSAYLSIYRNIPYLFTFDSITDIVVPNTTNLLEGTFTDLKNKLRNHNGLSQRHKEKFINEFFKA